MDKDNECAQCGKYSGASTLCNKCQKEALKNPAKPIKPKATPKALIEATGAAIETGMAFEGSKHIKDFIAQHFGIAMLEAESDEEAMRLRKLFERITK